jgi:hypothetical protein
MIGLILIFAIKSFPVYMSHYQVFNALEWAANQQELTRAPVSEIRKRIGRKFDTGYVRHITRDDIVVKRKPGGIRTIGVKYEVRKPLFYNIDLVYKFETLRIMKRDKTASSGI